MNSLIEAIELACKVHNNHIDKGNKPYILHPLHVMLQMKTTEEQIVAVLHDVLEDAESWIKDNVREQIYTKFSRDVIEDIFAITRKKNESYDDYIYRVSQSEVAAKVKLADLKHNMDIGRITNPTERDFKNMAKYAKAYAKISSEWGAG